jgi:hypothetical protein
MTPLKRLPGPADNHPKGKLPETGPGDIVRLTSPDEERLGASVKPRLFFYRASQPKGFAKV